MQQFKNWKFQGYLTNIMATITGDNGPAPLQVLSDVVEKARRAGPLSVDSLSDDEESVDSEDDLPLSIIEIAKKETKDVVRHKVLVLFILLASASSIATGLFLFVSRGETSHFETKFDSDAAKLLDGIGGSLYRTLGLFDILATQYVSHARHQNETWPFVTLPDFGARMAKLLPLTDANYIGFLPIVPPEQKQEWEKYSVENDEWVNQTIMLQETWDGFYGDIDYGWQPYGVIFSDYGDIAANIRCDNFVRNEINHPTL
jgi:hypothetical protein